MSKKEEVRPSFDFEAIYARYPHKEGKKGGMRKLAKSIKTAAQLAEFERAMDNYIALCIAERRERRYIKHWSTFCGCWEDYLEVTPPDGPIDQLQRIICGEL